MFVELKWQVQAMRLSLFLRSSFNHALGLVVKPELCMAGNIAEYPVTTAERQVHLHGVMCTAISAAVSFRIVVPLLRVYVPFVCSCVV